MVKFLSLTFVSAALLLSSGNVNSVGVTDLSDSTDLVDDGFYSSEEKELMEL